MPDPALPFLFAGFAAVWVILGGYLVYLWRAQRTVVDRLEALERHLANEPRPPADAPGDG